ncbi:hypothetical protein IM792_07470 [Mucilaginibacter sp. JRF]|uniref:hypothetical protein n=1 Tax=Mucilaginibacter sp. JRF TaxID=2780088 RepID=UPI00188112ED|nr:hypothetical protein [Mucilaginibacter sp. JRF]MBE9584281.1 hypothetical protein [Mucilaginibacter sp. JRF]
MTLPKWKVFFVPVISIQSQGSNNQSIEINSISLASALAIAFQIIKKAMITFLLLLAIVICMWLFYKSIDWFEKI